MAFDPYLNRNYGKTATDVQLTQSSEFKRSLEAKGESKAEVYDWHITKLDESQILSMTQVATLVRLLHTDARASYALPARAGWHADQHRQSLVDMNEAYKRFTESHPRLFLALTDPELSPEKLRHIQMMIGMKKVHVDSKTPMDKQQRDISMYFKTHFVRAAEPGEEEAAIASGRGYHAEMVRGPVSTK